MEAGTTGVGVEQQREKEKGGLRRMEKKKKKKRPERRKACSKPLRFLAPVAEQLVEPYTCQHPELREEDQVRDDDRDLAREARVRHWKVFFCFFSIG